MAKTRTEIQAKYDAANRTPFSFKLHNTNDADIIAKLKSVPSINGYIKQLIRQDIAGSVPVSDSVPNPYSDPYADIIAQAVQSWNDRATSILTDRKQYIVEESVPKTEKD